jgi:alpha-mannosidase
MVNFKASQGGEIPLRYRLTTHSGAVDDVEANRFGLEQSTPAVAMRDYIRTGPESGQFLVVPQNAPVAVTAKAADDEDGIIVRVQNLSDDQQSVPLRFDSAPPKSANLTSPLEINRAELTVEKGSITVQVAGLATQSLRVRF